MRRVLSIIFVLQIMLVHAALAAPHAFANSAVGPGDDAAREDRKLRIFLSVPIGTENVGYEKTTCTVKYKPDSTNRLGFKASEFECRKEFVKEGGCEPLNPVEDCEVLMEDGDSSDSWIEPECVAGRSDEGQEQQIVYCRPVQVIKAGSGSGLIKAYTALIYRWAAGTVGIVAVLVIVVSGIQIITSDISGEVDNAKNRIAQSLIGLVILFLSAVILYTINPNFFN